MNWTTHWARVFFLLISFQSYQRYEILCWLSYFKILSLCSSRGAVKGEIVCCDNVVEHDIYWNLESISQWHEFNVDINRNITVLSFVLVFSYLRPFLCGNSIENFLFPDCFNTKTLKTRDRKILRFIYEIDIWWCSSKICSWALFSPQLHLWMTCKIFESTCYGLWRWENIQCYECII